MMLKMWDAATPPATLPAGYHAAAGYVGGDAYRVWTRGDWARVGEAGLRGLPIWVRSDPAGHTEGLQDGDYCGNKLEQLGVPHGCPIALDRETSVDLSYVQGFAFALRDWRLVEYGSPADLFKGTSSPYGYWPANPTGYLHWNPVGLPYDEWPPGVHAVQCIWAAWDTSVIGPQFHSLLWKPSATLAGEPADLGSAV